MALEFRSDQLPKRTIAERQQYWHGVLVVKWAAAVLAVLAFGLLLLDWTGNVGGTLVLVPVVAVIAAVHLSISQRALRPQQDALRQWREVLVRCGLFPAAPAEQPPVRFLAGSRYVNEVAIKLPRGKSPDMLEKQLPAIALAWDLPAVHGYKRIGGWFSLHLVTHVPTVPLPESPVFDYKPVRPVYRLPVARSWKQYFEALPVGKLHRHTAAEYRSGDYFASGGMTPEAAGIDPMYVLPREWGLRLLGSHLLVAGQTGAGKSSWVQSIISVLRPAVAHGAAVLVAIDPKGVELALGRGFFKYYASEFDTICELLEKMVSVMSVRKAEMAGKSRLVNPTAQTPLYVIFIDELAAVGKLDPDAKRRARTLAAMNLILTQGRALGFSVVGAVQDPTKETLPNRDLFNVRVALRLTGAMTDLVLGPKCREEGAAAHQLTEEWAGAGYLHDGKGWALVRATWTSDNDIIAQAQRFRDGAFLGDAPSEMFIPIDSGTPQIAPPSTHSYAAGADERQEEARYRWVMRRSRDRQRRAYEAHVGHPVDWPPDEFDFENDPTYVAFHKPSPPRPAPAPQPAPEAEPAKGANQPTGHEWPTVPATEYVAPSYQRPTAEQMAAYHAANPFRRTRTRRNVVINARPN